VNLRTPGPTPMPPNVAEALQQPMINHRGPEFADLLADVTSGVQDAMQTRNDVLMLTSSGTGGMEAAIANFFSPGERVLAVIIGNFGDRFATIAERFGLEVERLAFPNGHAADPAAVSERLAASPGFAGVLVTHNETSTGTTNELEALAAAVRGKGPLLLVDGVSSAGSIEIKTDEWGIDVLVSASQKGWMIPPGIAMIAISSRAWEAQQRAKLPRYYWDLALAKKEAARGQTPWTPAITVLYGFREALQMLRAEGFPAVFARHQRIGAYTRGALKELGLRLVPVEDRWASNTVSAFWLPEGTDEKTFLETLRVEYDIVLAGGQAELAGRTARIGHMGLVAEADIDAVADAMRRVLAAPTAAKR
jgi:aspartate aminotransferase-like enzyme